MSSLNITVDQSLVAPIVEAQIQAAIVRELGAQGQLIEDLVAAALNDKVGYDGRKAQYASDNKYNLVALLVQKKIQEAAREALGQYLDEHKAAVRDAVIKTVEQNKDAMVQAFVSSITKAADPGWGITVSFKKPED